MNLLKKKIIPLALGLVMASVPAMAFTACGDSADQYTVTYHLNYDGAQLSEREVEIPAGAHAVSWTPSREGYTIEGWYTDAECRSEYNFDTAVRGNIDLYALWQEHNTYTVTFDSNYSLGDVFKIEAGEGEIIDPNLVPEVERMGRTFTGWYTDSQCTVPWNLQTDKITSDITLYAGYALDSSVPRDSQGNLVYQDITVNVWIGANFNTLPVFEKLAEEFNAQREGEIYVNVTTSLDNQDTFSLRFQQTPEKSRFESTYYSAEDVYDLAGIPLDKNSWYQEASRDSYYMGELTSIPLVGGAPFVIYNKTLMQKYNGGNELPSNYSELTALLQKAYEGESASNANFKSMLAAYESWDWRETPSYISFAQNGADYYVYENGHYVNKWDSDETMFDNAVTAMQNTYDLFGTDGAYHGGQAGLVGSAMINAVSSGNALMGMVTVPTYISNVLSSSELGVMPLSGLFTDRQGGQSEQIPVHTIGLAFYRAGDLSLTELAAAAEFAEFVSQNSYAFAETGWYPLRKSVVQSEQFRASSNTTVQLLQQVGDPENFRTLDGLTDGKKVINDIAAGSYILPALQSGLNSDSLQDYVREMMYMIKGELY